MRDERLDLDFDKALHSEARFKIMLVLSTRPDAQFDFLVRATGLTVGNLSSHLKTLEAAGYATSRRVLANLAPRVRYAVTPTGREALRRYCAILEQAVQALQRAVREEPERPL